MPVGAPVEPPRSAGSQRPAGTGGQAGSTGAIVAVVVALVAVAALLGPIGIRPIGRIGASGQAATVDLFSSAGGSNPAPAARPPAPAWTYRPEGQLVSVDVGERRAYLLQRLGPVAQVMSIDLATGLEAWRRTLPGVVDARIEVDGDQLLVVTAQPGIDPTAPGYLVQAFDETTANERWSTHLSSTEVLSRTGRWVVIRPRPIDDGTVSPGTVRVLDRRTGETAWSRVDSATVDLGHDEAILADAGGLALVAMSTGREVGRFPAASVTRPFLAAPHELGVATSEGLVFPSAQGDSAQFIRVDGLRPATARRLDDNVTVVSSGGSVKAVDRRTSSVVDLAPADADGLYAVGAGSDARLLFSWSDHFVTLDPDGANRRERSFTTGERTVAGFAGWLVYACEGRSGVAAYDVRTLSKVWRVTVPDRPTTGCAMVPTPGGFLTVEADGLLRVYR